MIDMRTWLFLFFFSIVSYSHSKPTLLTFVVRYEPDYYGPQDVVTIDPETGKVEKLSYHLPSADKLCAQIDQERELIYVLNKTDNLAVYSLKDGHKVESYNISTTTRTFFKSWNYNANRKVLYGICLKPDQKSVNWNFTWCYVHFDENRTGKLYYENYVSSGEITLGSGFCNDIHMNKDTFLTGQYWYTLYHSVIVKNVSSPNGDPWNTLLTVDDKVDFDSQRFAAIVTGKFNEYIIVIHYEDASNSYLVTKLLAPGGQEVILAKFPAALSSQALDGLPWAYDEESQMVYALMQTTNPTKYMLPDTLVKVDLTQHPEKAVETIKLSFDSLGYDEVNYTVFETYFINM